MGGGDVRRRPEKNAVMMLLFSTSILSFSGFTLDDHGCVTDYSATVDYFPPERRAIMNGASTASDTYFGSAGITVRASGAARARAQLSGSPTRAHRFAGDDGPGLHHLSLIHI